MKLNVEKSVIAAVLIFYLSLETSAAAIGERSFTCSNLDCPNGSICEIKQIPSDDKKSVRITTQCSDAEGNILDEETITEDVPEGKIPFTSIKRKAVNGDTSGAYFGSSYAAKSIVHGGIGDDGTTTIDFVPVDADDVASEFHSGFDKIWTIFDTPIELLKKTTGFFDW